MVPLATAMGIATEKKEKCRRISPSKSKQALKTLKNGWTTARQARFRKVREGLGDQTAFLSDL